MTHSPQPMLSGPALRPHSGGKADSLVILLHGYGDSGDGLIGLGHEWAPDLPNTAFAAPHGVAPCEVWPQGYQWFPIRVSDGPLAVRELNRREVIKPPADALDAYIDAQLALWGVDESRLVVAGFSQGAMMAMYTMPRRQKPCAGVIGYSGMLVDPDGLKEAGIVKMPALVIHGADDEVVPPACLTLAGEGFSAAGFDVETILRPGLGHSIDHFGFMQGLSFIQKAFDK